MSSPDLDLIMEEATRAKLYHHELAQAYLQRMYGKVVSEFKRLYGRLVTARYEVYDFKPRPTLLTYLILERWALKRRGIYKNVVVSIVGTGGAQKTTYAVNSLIRALERMGVDARYVRDLFLFDAETMIARLKSLLKEGRWVPAIILDDVGAIISKYWVWLEEREKWIYFFSILDQAKDWTGVLIMTARNVQAIPKRLREISDFIVFAREAYMEGAYVVLMEYYDANRYDPYKLRGLLYLDVYPPTELMPEWLWREMRERRRELGLRRIEEIERLEEERRRKREGRDAEAEE